MEVPPVDIVPPRHDLLYGYYGDSTGQVAATADHVNVEFLFGYPDGSTATLLAHAAESVGAGHKIILGVCWRCGEANIRWTFDSLRTIGALSSVVALYPQDEPDVALMSAETVITLCNDVRNTAHEYSELSGVNIAVIYGNVGPLPGIACFDWVGRDVYGAGPQTLPLLAHQRLLLVPGGAFHESPDAHIAYANAHPEVVAIIGFLWRWPSGPDAGHGIADNGLAETYRAAGRAILH